MSKSDEHLPGARAPAAGHYEELNIFGSPTGKTTHTQEGDRLPLAPLGFRWRPLEREVC
jgi:hypothetical protein